MNWDPEQTSAICSSSNRILCNAGAGSGKTAVLAGRVEHLLNQGVRESSILVVTFTRKAAGELKRRCSSYGANIWTGTFHSVALDIIRKHAAKLGYVNTSKVTGPGVVMGRERSDLVRIAAEHSLSNPQAEHIFESLSWTGEPDLQTGDDKRFWNEYRTLLKVGNLIDVGQLLPAASKLIKSHDRVYGFYHDRFSHVLVDEAHDSNVAQWGFVDSFKPDNLFVIFDRRQCIYEWNGSRPELVFERFGV